MASISASPNPVEVGQSVTITWSGTGALVVKMDWPCGTANRRVSGSSGSFNVVVPCAGDTLVALRKGNKVLASTVLHSYAPAPPPPSGIYTFEDNFDGTSIDSTKWWRETRWDGDSRWQQWGTFSDDPTLYSVAGGVLTLTAKRIVGTDRFICPILSTRGKFSQVYGIFTARLKWSRGHALWPAFWLHNVPNTIDEIDVLEAYPESSHPDFYQTTTHWVGGQQGANQTAPDADWHDYEVEWRGSTTIYRRDGVAVATITGPIAGVAMFPILNLMVGVWFNNTVPDATTPDAPTLQVDWVRVSA